MIQSISLCSVVYNEGHRIFDFLIKNAPLVSETIIVDQSSTDNTMEEIDRYRDMFPFPVYTVLDKHWGYCEPSRKLAHQHSEGSWVLVLDADETVSTEFINEMWSIDELKEGWEYHGARLKRSLWIAGEHRFTGDYQYRFFNRSKVRYLDELHTEPQPTTHKSRIYSPDYVGIWHRKSWVEQVRDELSYEELLKNQKGHAAEVKRGLNITIALLREKGITPEEADAMTQEEKEEAGIASLYKFEA